MKLDVEIDTALNYTIYEKIGDLNYRPTSTMTFEEFKQYQDRQILKKLLARTDHGRRMERVLSVAEVLSPRFLSVRYWIGFLAVVMSN